METRSMGQNADLVQFRKEFKQLKDDIEDRNARLEKKQDDQFAFISARQDRFEKKQDDQFAFLSEQLAQVMRGIQESQRAPEQRDKSSSFDTMEANFGSTSKGRIHATNGAGFQAGDGFHTKSIRLEFPKFDGEDPLNWCYKAEQFFDHYSTPDCQRLKISSFHMEGTALIWFQELHKSNSFATWDDFARALQKRFGMGFYDDPMESLAKLTQGGSLEEDKKQFKNSLGEQVKLEKEINSPLNEKVETQEEFKKGEVKAEGSSAESIAALDKVDTVKQRMEAAYETLNATVEDVFANGDLPRADETLANMRHCLSAVGEVAVFANVEKQLCGLKFFFLFKHRWRWKKM